MGMQNLTSETKSQNNIINIIVGFDQREAICYHTFCQSVLEKTSVPVQFLPLAKQSLPGYKENQIDGSNDFVYTRFLSPWLMNYENWVIFVDGDMVCNHDILKLWQLRDSSKAIQVVMHDYLTKSQTKYLGNKNENYPRKNWSSVILWNCGHPKNKLLTPEFIRHKDGAFLHRFQWLDNEEIGELPKEWNWLATEYEPNPDAKIIHYTLGTPCFMDYKNAEMADYWHQAFSRMKEGLQS
jgi:lipopolysaccharide biosynthesis glycosyltransferase